jgi:hypothetical protein
MRDIDLSLGRKSFLVARAATKSNDDHFSFFDRDS